MGCIMGNCCNALPKVLFISHGGPAENKKCLEPPPILTMQSSGEKDGIGELRTPRSKDETLSPHLVKAISFSELKNATCNFRLDSLLGEGGFGYVYKGWLDSQTLTAARPGSGIVVAVKKLKPQGFLPQLHRLIKDKVSFECIQEYGPTSPAL